MSTEADPSSYALLSDGTTIGIRPARPEDFEAVRDMHTKMSPDNLYLPGSVGRAILRNITTGGFSGLVYAVNPGASELDGVRCVPSAAALPAPVTWR